MTTSAQTSAAIGTGHPRDISAEDMEIATAAATRADLLQRLAQESRQAFGFYTSHFPHTVNYPWIIERLEGLPEGSQALDIGAGVSPVPLLLAQKGVRVDCVDNSKYIRTLPSGPDWNEWGFFDYATLHPNLKAHHCDIGDFSPSILYHAIYSVSSIVHMPRTCREDMLRHCHGWLHPRGLLVLAVDLIPSSDFLWNRADGVEVETPIRHGTVDDLMAQITGLGFEVDEFTIKRGVYKSRTDLLFIAGRKN
jgi:hypothetical protein